MGRRILEAILGILLIIAAIVLAYLFQQQYSKGVELQTMPVPVADIPPYTMLTDSMFEWRDFPRALGDSYALDLAHLTGRISKSAIPAGLPIPLIMVSSASDFRLADPNLEILSIPITPPSAVGGQVRVGERINIYRLVPPASKLDLTSPDNLGAGNVTLMAENVPVLSVLGNDGSLTGTGTSGRLVTPGILVLAVTADQRNNILKLIAETKQSALMWITLAPVEQ
jgi:hypothetical protein